MSDWNFQAFFNVMIVLSSIFGGLSIFYFGRAQKSMLEIIASQRRVIESIISELNNKK